MLEINIRHWPFVRWSRVSPTQAAVGWAFLSVNIAVASTYNVFAKVVTSAISPLALLLFSEMLTIFFTLFSFGAVPTLKKLLTIPKERIAPMLTVGLCSGLIAPALWFTGLAHSTATNATLLGNVELMFMALLAVIVLKEKWTMWHLGSVCSMLTGAVIISLEGFQQGFQVHAGDALLILGAMTFGFGSILFRKFLHGSDPEVTVLVRSIVPVTVLLALSPFLSTAFAGEAKNVSGGIFVALLAFGFISRFMSTFSFYQAIERLPVTTVSLFMNLVMVGSVTIAHFGLGEPIYGYHFVGGAFILMGIVLLEFIGLHPSDEHLEAHLSEKKATRI